ncbi:hypothetical protein EE612_043293 [Oryza sativa]|nr:hypothetical protein EE612_043293 [Oryza sativa]
MRAIHNPASPLLERSRSNSRHSSSRSIHLRSTTTSPAAMCSGKKQGGAQPTMAPAGGNGNGNSHRVVGRKRLLVAGGAGEEDRLRGKKRAAAGALVPYVAAALASAPIDAVPLAAVAPASSSSLAAGEVPNEPSWIRKIVFYRLGLPYDLPLVFIEEKTVTRTDLDSHQNRFRLACGGVGRSLIPMLTRREAIAASFLRKEEDEAQAAGLTPPQPEENNRRKKKKKKGRSHGGLPVTLVHLRGGMKRLLLTRWDSSGAAIIKGEGYLDFIARCGIKEKDVVHVWAFKQQGFRLFGATYPPGPLYILIAGTARLAAPPPPQPPVAQSPPSC